jgi:hypothetical protein
MSTSTKGTASKERDLRKIFAYGGAGFLLLTIAILGVNSALQESSSADERITVQHVVVTERNVDLSNFKDADNDGIVDKDERKPVKIPAGCYQLTISGPQGTFSATPSESTDVGGALRIGFRGDMGYKNGDKISVPEGAQFLAGIVNPVAGSHLIDPNTGAVTWKTVNVSFTEATSCSAG